VTLAELRAAIARARDAGERDKLGELQAQYRGLAIDVRRELLTAERVDERSGRRVIIPAGAARMRAVSRATSVPAAADAQPTLYGHFAVFNTWSEIESLWEGNFMESIAPGAFAKTITDDRAQMRVTLNHGRDPFLGNKVLGRIDQLSEDKTGAAYDVGLYRGIPELVLEGLRDDAYGASFRFYVMAENFVEKPKPSSYNPRGIPERTITEAMVEEFGPVTFPQYPEASAHLRSLIPQRATKPAAAGAVSTPKRRDQWIRSI
jgi:phage head maturation protease